MSDAMAGSENAIMVVILVVAVAGPAVLIVIWDAISGSLYRRVVAERDELMDALDVIRDVAVEQLPDYEDSAMPTGSLVDLANSVASIKGYKDGWDHARRVFDGYFPSPKMTRETLIVAQAAIQERRYDHDQKPARIAMLQELIDECDRRRPLGPDGKHGERHTALCGCSPDSPAIVAADLPDPWAER